MHAAPGWHMDVVNELEPLSSAWDELAMCSGSIFHTYEWNALSWRYLEAGQHLCIGVGRADDGSLKWLAPMFRQRIGPVRFLRFIADGASDALGPIASPDDAEQAGVALRRFLAETPGWDVAVMRHLPGPTDWAALLGGIALRSESSPTLALAGRSWDEYLATRSANFRQRVRKDERVLARNHRVEYRLADDPDRLADDLETLFRLHALRWNGPGAFAGAKEEFHRTFAAAALQRGWLRLWFLELDGVPIATWYGFRYGNADWFYQSGRDQSYDRLHIGAVLLAHTMRVACEDGIENYHLLRGPERYKQGFATADHGLQTVAVARGLRGRGALVALRTLLKRFPKVASRFS